MSMGYDKETGTDTGIVQEMDMDTDADMDMDTDMDTDNFKEHLQEYRALRALRFQQSKISVLP
jgi:hypothetical protein